MALTACDTSEEVSVLLVEDNAQLTATLARGIAECGFEVEVEHSGQRALRRILSGRPDVIVLDLGLPDIDGLEVLVNLRSAGVGAPVLVLTARSAVASRVSALDCGADDYLIKPIDFSELIARLRALLRRAAAPRWAPLGFGAVRLDDDGLVAHVGSQAVKLSPREHSLLRHLVRRGSDVSTRRELLTHVFGYAFDPGTNVIEVHVTNLRRKLAGTALEIENVRGAGYRLRARAAQADRAEG